MSSLFIYTSCFETSFLSETENRSKNPFWNLLFQVSEHDPESVAIIVSSSEIKKWIMKELCRVLPEQTIVPEILTIDELLIKNTSVPISDTKIFDLILFKNILENSFHKDTWFKDIQSQPGFSKQFFSFAKEDLSYT